MTRLHTHPKSPRYREKKMQMQSEESEPKKSKFGVFREIPKDRAVKGPARLGKKHREKNIFQTSRGFGAIVVLGGWVGVCVFFWGGLLDCFGVIFFLKTGFFFLSC